MVKRELRQSLARWTHNLDQENEDLRGSIRRDLDKNIGEETGATWVLMKKLNEVIEGEDVDPTSGMLALLARVKLAEIIGEYVQEMADDGREE